MKYKRYVPKYRKGGPWFDAEKIMRFLAAFFDARDAVALTGRPVTISEFSGWRVAKVVDSDFSGE